MPYISYDRTSLHSTSTEVAIYYHVRRAILGAVERRTEPHNEIIDACLDGPLHGALNAIREWGSEWAPKVALGFDFQEVPEIALNLNVTSRGNLEITWLPILTQQQFDAAPPDFHRWIAQLEHKPNGQRRHDQLYFLRGFDRLHWMIKGDYGAPEMTELSRISAVALAVLMAELPGRLADMVQAHWQDMIDFGFPETPGGDTPVPTGMAIHSMWTRLRDQAENRLQRKLSELGVDADRLTKEWNRISVTHPRIWSDSGRSKAVATVLGVRPDQVDHARSAITDMGAWRGEKPRLWWNRTDPYPLWWGRRLRAYT